MRLQSVLDQAARRDEVAVLHLSRRVTALLDKYGAYTVRKDWSESTRELRPPHATGTSAAWDPK